MYQQRLFLVGSRPPLGEFLIEKGLLTEEGLKQALEAQRRTGDRLGRVLMSLGLLKRRQLYTALAELWQLPFIDLLTAALEPETARQIDAEVLVNHRFIPLHLQQNQGRAILQVAVSDQPTLEVHRLCQNAFGEETEIHFWVTTDWDIDKRLAEVFRDQLLATATMGLYFRNPLESAYQVFRPWQIVALWTASVMLALGLLFATLPTVILVSLLVNIGFLAAISFKGVTSMAGRAGKHVRSISEEELSSLNEGSLPTYTILVPVYREANIVGKLMQNLRTLDYPASKLEILLLLEEEDEETLASARAADPPETVTFVIVPNGAPRTKPRACNVGLFFAKGEYLVIYDAEDRPEPDQLKKAVVAFRRADEKLICVQAALNYYNRSENLLTRMFTLEYSYWFDYMLPGLDRLRLPIPLGAQVITFAPAPYESLVDGILSM